MCKILLRRIFFIIILLMVIPVCLYAVDNKENFRPTKISLKLLDKPESHEQGWKVIQFQNKLPNKVKSDEDGLHIGVESSVDLLTYCLDEPIDVNGVFLQGSVTCLPKIPEDKQQGDKQADDFVIRFGLVISGTKKLSRMDKYFASGLVKHLCELVPKSYGIDHVLFLNLANDPPPEWQKRIHPIGKGLIREQICSVKNKPGDFVIRAIFHKPCTVLALCIICDGDDTKSKYQVNVNNIQLNPKEKKESN